MKCYFYLSFLLTYLCIANVSQAQTGASPLKHSQDISQKVIGSLRAEFSDVAVGQGLPVLSLDAPDWYAKLNSQSGVKRAWHTARAELAWEHLSGWQLSALARAEASVDASPDAVLLTQLNVRRTEPTNEQMFQIAANSLQWRGQGVRLYSPWLGLNDSSWSVRADLQMLNLTNLRVNNLNGSVLYGATGAYGVDLNGLRVNPEISGLFVPIASSSGQARSASLIVRGVLTSDLRIEMAVEDIWSELSWAGMLQDQSKWNTNVVQRAADLTLNYAAVVQGQVSKVDFKTQMEPLMRVSIDWDTSPSTRFGGTWRTQWARKAGIDTAWFGWHSNERVTEKAWWSIMIEPRIKALGLGFMWRGLQVSLATDGQGDSSQLRSFNLAYAYHF